MEKYRDERKLHYCKVKLHQEASEAAQGQRILLWSLNLLAELKGYAGQG